MCRNVFLAKRRLYNFHNTKFAVLYYLFSGLFKYNNRFVIYSHNYRQNFRNQFIFFFNALLITLHQKKMLTCCFRFNVENMTSLF